MTKIILPQDSNLYRTFQQMAQQRIVFFTGLPGTGKSLLLQQMALMAQAAGRTVHLLQYDVARLAFETPESLAKYPEIDGFTHAAIRKAVGLWTRTGVQQWDATFLDPAHFLLGELPLVGNRLIELTQTLNDAAERVLTRDDTWFLLPVPSNDVRRIIESAREKSIAQPRHQKEQKDAQPNVLRALWQEVAQVGMVLGLTDGGAADYDPAVYTAVYQHLLQHRHTKTLSIDTILKPAGSAYDLSINGTELSASPFDVQAIVTAVEKTYTPDALEHAVAQWFEV